MSAFRLIGATLEPALWGSDFAFPQGVVRVAGADASLLLECLAGLRPLRQGEYRWEDITMYPADAAAARSLRRVIGCAFDHRGLLFGLSLFENLLLPLLYHRHLNQQAAEARALHYLRRIDLETERERRPAQVTAPQRKLCALARSLITHPKLVIWDEPAQGIAETEALVMADWLQEHRRLHGLQQVFLTTEDHGLLGRLQPATVTLADGRLQGGGAP